MSQAFETQLFYPSLAQPASCDGKWAVLAFGSMRYLIGLVLWVCALGLEAAEMPAGFYPSFCVGQISELAANDFQLNRNEPELNELSPVILEQFTGCSAMAPAISLLQKAGYTWAEITQLNGMARRAHSEGHRPELILMRYNHSSLPLAFALISHSGPLNIEVLRLTTLEKRPVEMAALRLIDQMTTALFQQFDLKNGDELRFAVPTRDPGILTRLHRHYGFLKRGLGVIRPPRQGEVLLHEEAKVVRPIRYRNLLQRDLDAIIDVDKRIFEVPLSKGDIRFLELNSRQRWYGAFETDDEGREHLVGYAILTEGTGSGPMEVSRLGVIPGLHRRGIEAGLLSLVKKSAQTGAQISAVLPHGQTYMASVLEEAGFRIGMGELKRSYFPDGKDGFQRIWTN